MLDNVKTFLADKTATAAQAAAEGFEKLIPQALFDNWHAFTHKMFIAIILVIIALVLVNTVFDSVRRVIRGLDVAAVGGVILWGSTKIPNIVFIRELISPMQKLGMVLVAVGVVLFIVFKVTGKMAKKGSNAIKSAVTGADAERTTATTSGKSAASTVIAVILALAIGAGAGYGVDHYVINKPVDSKVTLETVSEKFSDIYELATYQLDYEDNAAYEGDPRTLFGKNVPFTKKSMRIHFAGTIKAGPNMEKSDIKVNEEGNEIKITVPHSEILSHEIDEDSIYILEVKNGLFNRIDLDNNNEARKQAKEQKEENVLATDFLDKADANAIKVITDSIQTAFPEAKVTVVVK